MVKKIESYASTSGKMYATPEEAVREDQEQVLRKYLRKTTPNWSYEDFIKLFSDVSLRNSFISEFDEATKVE